MNWFEGQWVLVGGEIGSGKTRFTEKMLPKMIAREGEIAIFDFAPENVSGVGGKMKIVNNSRMDYYSDNFYAPRLTGKDKKEVLLLAELNAQKIERLLAAYQSRPRDIVVINDVSIYLQSRTAKQWLSNFYEVDTILANGYYGYYLGSDDFSQRERQEMENLMQYQDLVIFL